MRFYSIAFLAVLALVVFVASTEAASKGKSNNPCVKQGGTCVAPNLCRNGQNNGRGLCPGRPMNDVCCIPFRNTPQCTRLGGTCKLAKQCAGKSNRLVNNVCKTRANNVKCCVPKTKQSKVTQKPTIRPVTTPKVTISPKVTTPKVTVASVSTPSSKVTIGKTTPKVTVGVNSTSKASTPKASTVGSTIVKVGTIGTAGIVSTTKGSTATSGSTSGSTTAKNILPIGQ